MNMSDAPAVITRAAGLPPLLVDTTHLGRHVTGIERITEELFSPAALAPFAVHHVRAPLPGVAGLIAGQQVRLPWRLLRQRRAIGLFPGFPPAPLATAFGSRVVPYVHDLFPLLRAEELSLKARRYIAPALHHAVSRLPRFMVNSEKTAAQLRQYCRADAAIHLYRPAVRNVFGVSDADRAEREEVPRPLRLLVIGTLEPRKNLSAAAEITAALNARGVAARLDIVGRPGWGGVAEALEGRPHVHLHGYLETPRLREMLQEADVFITTSHDEGLGLPLLEAQYAGLPVAAPDRQVFREVLGGSGVWIDSADAAASADRITALIAESGWRRRHLELARANIQRWNAQAARDHAAIIDMLLSLATGG